MVAKSNKIYRQGDVLLTRLTRKPSVGKSVAQGRIVLALGETSGHAHVIEGAVAEFRAADGERIVWLEAPQELRHVAGKTLTGEHNSIPLLAGWYVAEQQCELVDDDEVRQVYD